MDNTITQEDDDGGELIFVFSHQGADYMASFSPGFSTFFHFRYFVSLNIPSPHLHKLTFQPGLKFGCDYIRFSSIPAWAEIPSLVFLNQAGNYGPGLNSPGQQLSPCISKRPFKTICSGSRAESPPR